MCLLEMLSDLNLQWIYTQMAPRQSIISRSLYRLPTIPSPLQPLHVINQTAFLSQMRSFFNGLDATFVLLIRELHILLLSINKRTKKCAQAPLHTAHRRRFREWLILALLLARQVGQQQISRVYFKVCASCLTSSAIAHKSGQFPFSLVVSFAVGFFICQVFKFPPLSGSKIIFLPTRRPPLDRFVFFFFLWIISRHRFSLFVFDRRELRPRSDYKPKKVEICETWMRPRQTRNVTSRIDNRRAIARHKAGRNVTTKSRKSRCIRAMEQQSRCIHANDFIFPNPTTQPGLLTTHAGKIFIKMCDFLPCLGCIPFSFGASWRRYGWGMPNLSIYVDSRNLSSSTQLHDFL